MVRLIQNFKKTSQPQSDTTSPTFFYHLLIHLCNKSLVFIWYVSCIKVCFSLCTQISKKNIDIFVSFMNLLMHSLTIAPMNHSLTISLMKTFSLTFLSLSQKVKSYFYSPNLPMYEFHTLYFVRSIFWSVVMLVWKYSVDRI